MVRVQTDLDGKTAELPAYVIVKPLETADRPSGGP